MSTTEQPAGLAEFKERAHKTWAAGDFDEIAQLILDVGEAVVEGASPQAGESVLDIACGSGNATIPAARTGARAVGLDITPELFDDARRHAAEAGVEIELVEGDAEALPFEDASFDVVISTFGIMFAPRHDVAAAELARVLRPGGRVCLANWTPEGYVGEFFRTIGSFMPPPPDFASPPPLWGTEDHVRGLLEPHGLELEFEPRTTHQKFADVESAITKFETKFGPTVMAKALLEPQGRWEEVRTVWREVMQRWNTADEGLDIEAEYLITRGTKTS